MKKIIPLLILLIAAAFSAGAQILSIDHKGENLPSRYWTKIEQTLLKEINFYGPLGLPDTVRLKLVVFKDKKSGNAFIRQYDPLAYGNYCSGMFLPRIETAVIVSTENMEWAVKTLIHEISHFLYHKSVDVFPSSATNTAASLNEGLSCYFEFMDVRKDGSVRQKPDIEYINNVKSLVEIDDFRIGDYLQMYHSQFTEKQRNDGNISYYVSYAIVATLFEKLGQDKMRELLAMIRYGTSYKDSVESIYPGGAAGLEEDVRQFVLNY